MALLLVCVAFWRVRPQLAGSLCLSIYTSCLFHFNQDGGQFSFAAVAWIINGITRWAAPLFSSLSTMWAPASGADPRLERGRGDDSSTSSGFVGGGVFAPSGGGDTFVVPSKRGYERI